MALFESMLTLVLLAIVLLQVSRGLTIPYPTMLAMAGVAVAALPWAPDIGIDPHLALALFIAPALLDAAYDLPPRAVARYWRALLALAVMAVLLTTAAVAWAGVAWAGLPLAAAIALGAIVAPPDAAAAAAMLGRFSLPRSTVTVLSGESLLNDAVALLIFSLSVAAASAPPSQSLSSLVPAFALAVPGGVLLGIVAGKAYFVLWRRLAGTLGGTLFEFVATFGVWVIAERLHLSAILAVVAYGMTLARYIPERQSPRDRVHSYSVWEATVFLLNVLAFLLMGLQARAIVTRLGPDEIWHAVRVSGVVLAIVVVVRVVWVMVYNRVRSFLARRAGEADPPTVAQGIVVAWCGMRGLVTLATALALPLDFPSRDLIVLSALAVVLGTLVLQGLTLGPLIRWLHFAPDHSFDRELSAARAALLNVAVGSLGDRQDDASAHLRAEFQSEQDAMADERDPHAVTEIRRLRMQVMSAKRSALAGMRRTGEIDDDVFHALEQELDWAELAASPPERFEIVEG
jgi:CPA1 family monovalent cation:H+ antiporter